MTTPIIKRSGVGVPLSGLLRPTPSEAPNDPLQASRSEIGPDVTSSIPDTVEKPPEAPDGQDEEVRPVKPVRRRRPQVGTLKGRKLYLSDKVFLRLKLEALQKGKKVSVLLEEILDQHLPRFSVQRSA
jgi:hypothetical protein